VDSIIDNIFFKKAIFFCLFIWILFSKMALQF
jgi:hypothetical protein